MTDNEAPPMIIFPALSYIFVRVERCVQLFSTFSDQQCPTPPPPPQKETVEENLSLPEPFLKVIPCQCMSSGRCSWVTADDMWPSGRNTDETAKVFAKGERVCQFASLFAWSVFVGTVVNALKCGLIFTQDRTIKTEFGARSDVTFKMATFHLAAAKARWVCQLLSAFLAKTCM